MTRTLTQKAATPAGTTRLGSLFMRLLGMVTRQPDSLFALRRELRECCIDEDARRRALAGMRDECWRSGV
jgi:hypothetical protein